jgi:hypothetical protein
MKKIDTGTDHLIASKKDGVGVLTLNRPEARNAMSSEMNQALREMLAQFEMDNEIRSIVLTGAGKGFCAGGDVKGMAAAGDGTVGKNTIDAAIRRQREHQRATSGKLFKIPKPTLASTWSSGWSRFRYFEQFPRSCPLVFPLAMYSRIYGILADCAVSSRGHTFDIPSCTKSFTSTR